MSTTRNYRSDLRTEQAVQTRAMIRSAARGLFERQGFRATTVAQIAGEAGVSSATVYAVFGGKSAILREMMDELEAAAGAHVIIDPLLAERDPGRQLAIFAHWIRNLFETGEPLLKATAAARGDDDVEALIETGNSRRLEGTTMLVRGWAKSDALRPGLSPKAGAQALWLLTSAELFLASRSNLGWSVDAYERWLISTAGRELFGDS